MAAVRAAKRRCNPSMASRIRIMEKRGAAGRKTTE